MKEHKIITKLRRPLENFSSYDLDELIQAYDEVRAECNRVKEDVSIALRQPHWMNSHQKE
jgi:predicted HNH restriction endonuclease